MIINEDIIGKPNVIGKAIAALGILPDMPLRQSVTFQVGKVSKIALAIAAPKGQPPGAPSVTPIQVTLESLHDVKEFLEKLGKQEWLLSGDFALQMFVYLVDVAGFEGDAQDTKGDTIEQV